MDNRHGLGYGIILDTLKFDVASNSDYNFYRFAGSGGNGVAEDTKIRLTGSYSAPFPIDNSNKLYYSGQQCLIEQLDSGNVTYSEINIIDNVSTLLSVQYLFVKFPLKYTYTSSGDLTVRITFTGLFVWGNTEYGSYIGADRVVNLSSFGHQIDIKRGGNLVSGIGGKLEIINTNKFYKFLDDNNIYINGKPIKIYEIYYLNDISDNEEDITLVGTFIAESPSWDVKTYTIPFTSFFCNRNINITKQINTTDFENAPQDSIGKTIPVVFGKSYNNSQYSKFVLTDSSESNVKLYYKLSYWGHYDDYRYMFRRPTEKQIEHYCFNCTGQIGASPSLTYTFRIALTQMDLYKYYTDGSLTLETSSQHIMNDLIGCYIDVIDGQESGQKRLITNAVIDLDTNPNCDVINLTISDYFSSGLIGDYAGTTENNSWIKIVDINRHYKTDLWPCKSFLDSSGNEINKNLDFFVYNEDKKAVVDVTGESEQIDARIIESNYGYFGLPKTLFSISGAENNFVQSDYRQITNNYDTTDSDIVLPVSEVKRSEYLAADYMDLWSMADWDFHNAYNLSGKYNGGIFNWGVNPKLTLLVDQTDYSNAVDKDADSYYYLKTRLEKIQSGLVMNGGLVLCFDISLPELDSDFDFSAAYLGVKASVEHTFVSGSSGLCYTFVQLKNKRFCGNINTKIIFERNNSFPNDLLYSLPDQYFGNVNLTNNRYYYYTNDSGQGYLSWPLSDINITSSESYNYLRDFFTLQIGFTQVVDPGDDINLETEFKFYECAIIFKKEISIKSEIFSFHSGRIYNDTWGSRKISTDLIESPIDILEHVCRLQKYESDALLNEINYGLSYANYPLIKTSGSGSFDDTSDDNLNQIRNLQTSFCLDEYNLCYTDIIKKLLCRNFNLISYIDSDGYECVKSIVKSNTTPSNAITLSDITSRETISIQEPETRDIFCQPFVRYNYNIASDSYDGLIAVRNVWKDNYSEGDVFGMTGSLAEEIWTLCHNLFLRSSTIEEPPSDLTDLRLVGGNSALDIAQQYLLNWINIMYSPVVKFKTHYTKVRGWYIGDRFNLTLPHQTNGNAVECIITKILYNLSPPDFDVDIEAIMYRETIGDSFFIAEKLTPNNDASDWSEILTAVGDDTDIAEVI